MNAKELDRKWQELAQQIANLEWRIATGEKQIDGFRLEKAKAEGQQQIVEELLRELADALPETPKSPKRSRHNGVAVEQPQEEEEA